ncbi:MAG: hypothetical protein CXT75_02690 [Methanobacteriota archaeon]|jgi:hypothetical protein|uniref:Uncharacterized protein n=1 Tax=Marine Group III euryarchaeote TaxID=2173149 RepID=A0A7J4GSP4_9ARCH|nr:MAG: hypothetical protein CXT75_02690 [Euryarchaeota archaeon]HIF37635.1 hypothetical protein [Marine Group III euryarchaeote]
MEDKAEAKSESEDLDSSTVEDNDNIGPPKITSRDILKIIFSRKTAPHALFLSIFLIVLGVFSSRSSQFSVDMILILGFGFSFGYLLAAFLMRFDSLKAYSVGTYRKILSLPIGFSLLISSIIWYLFEFTDYANQVRDFLSLALVLIFVLWQFAQAWWMRVPFKEIALSQMIKVKSKDKSEFGKYANIVSPISWSVIGFVIFLILESQGIEFSSTFKVTWFVMMSIIGVVLFYLLHRMYSRNWSDPMISVFSAYFSVGYWSFLAYHLGVMLYSMENQPSFVFDLVFMIVTIMLVIYSLSAQALRSEVRKNKKESKRNIMNRHNVIFYAISFTAAYGASSFFLASDGTLFVSNIKTVGFVSHLIVIASGILVLLLVNYTALVGRGLIDKGFVESMRNPKDN